ncbi:MAG: nucleoside-binding protein [Candidatus Riflebacteria bacterium]|nr:nucleoside-binding protein [Candidatus Riflebacteria bacterium]
MIRRNLTVVLYFIILCAVPASAKILWQDFSATLLNGSDYRVGDRNRNVFTFEHTAETSFGDSFLFYDHLRSRNGQTENYGEWSTRYGLGKIFKKDFSSGIIKDYFLSNTLEMGDNIKNTLYGIGIDFNIKPFQYFKIDYYRRINDKVENSWQTTVVWGLPFKIGHEDFVYDGFIDKTTSTKDEAASMNFSSQLKWLITPHLGVKDKVYVGIEYEYWDNKYGIKHTSAFPTNERNVNLLLQWHF